MPTRAAFPRDTLNFRCTGWSMNTWDLQNVPGGIFWEARLPTSISPESIKLSSGKKLLGFPTKTQGREDKTPPLDTVSQAISAFKWAGCPSASHSSLQQFAASHPLTPQLPYWELGVPRRFPSDTQIVLLKILILSQQCGSSPRAICLLHNSTAY